MAEITITNPSGEYQVWLNYSRIPDSLINGCFTTGSFALADGAIINNGISLSLDTRLPGYEHNVAYTAGIVMYMRLSVGYLRRMCNGGASTQFSFTVNCKLHVNYNDGYMYSSGVGGPYAAFGVGVVNIGATFSWRPNVANWTGGDTPPTTQHDVDYSTTYGQTLTVTSGMADSTFVHIAQIQEGANLISSYTAGRQVNAAMQIYINGNILPFEGVHLNEFADGEYDYGSAGVVAIPQDLKLPEVIEFNYPWDPLKEAWTRSLSQHSDKQGLYQFIQAFLRDTELLWRVMIDMQDMRQINKLEGVNLDIIGDLLGYPRTGLAYDLDQWFWADREDPWQTDTAPVWVKDAILGNQYSLMTDDQYRQKLIAHIRYIHSQGSVNEVLEVIKTMFNYDVKFERYSPYEVELIIDDATVPPGVAYMIMRFFNTSSFEHTSYIPYPAVLGIYGYKTKAGQFDIKIAGKKHYHIYDNATSYTLNLGSFYNAVAPPFDSSTISYTWTYTILQGSATVTFSNASAASTNVTVTNAANDTKIIVQLSATLYGFTSWSQVVLHVWPNALGGSVVVQTLYDTSGFNIYAYDNMTGTNTSKVLFTLQPVEVGLPGFLASWGCYVTTGASGLRFSIYTATSSGTLIWQTPLYVYNNRVVTVGEIVAWINTNFANYLRATAVVGADVNIGVNGYQICQYDVRPGMFSVSVL